MAILNAIIENKGNTLIIDFPHSIYDVYEKLLSKRDYSRKKKQTLK